MLQKNKARSQMHRCSYFFVEGSNFEDIVRIENDKNLSNIRESAREDFLGVTGRSRQSRLDHHMLSSPGPRDQTRESNVSLGTNDPFKTGNKHFLNMMRPLLQDHAHGKDGK